MLLCKFCNKECSSERSLRSHQPTCKNNPNRYCPKGGNRRGIKPWNFGLTSWSDHRIRSGENHPFYNKHFGSAISGHSDKTKEKISKKLSVNNKGGRCKWHQVGDQLVQGTWERDIGTKLTELGILWYKIKTNSDTIPYIIDGKIRHYTPDFYLPEYNLYLEIKGFWRGTDREKMNCVLSQCDGKKIVIIEKKEFEKILEGELVW